MKISEIINGVNCKVHNDSNIEISDITCDSRNVKKGTMFFCIVGEKADGHNFAKDAIDKGAVALVVTRLLDFDITQILVEDDREAMALLSSNFFGKPQEKLTMVGITGTNGKTTITYLLRDIAKAAGKKVGVIGTICNYVGEKAYKTANTTPESLELFRLLSIMVKENVDIVFMEVSSHSLVQKRVFGIEFEVGAFTNLSQDHLDYHKTMENYIEAKSILFQNSKNSLINGDEKYCEFLRTKAKGNVFTYGLNESFDFFGKDIEYYPFENKFKVINEAIKDEDFTVHIPGKFSVYNALCAIGIAKLLNFDLPTVKKALFDTKGVSGRCEVLTKEPFTVILDYAHTPDGLLNILNTFKDMKGRKVCLFGCGGNRDKTKRAIMGEIAGKLSDFVIITSDNPRFEEPMDIINQVEQGVLKTTKDYMVIEDRKKAIKFAITGALPYDIIIIAGKGHETYQDIKGVKYDFDDKAVVLSLLNN